jgi:hypothetical protein
MSNQPTLTIRKVESKADFKRFLEFPWTLYRDDPNWVPPVPFVRRSALDRKVNQAFEYIEADYFLAVRGADAVGTIAAFINKRHNQTWGENIGWFGFFECYDDPEAAVALLNWAADWVRAKGATALRGPASFTLNDECGLLIENFEPALFFMSYNPPYYQRLIEERADGFEKVMDTVSAQTDPNYYCDENGEFPAKLQRVVARTMARNKVTTRRADPRRLRAELNLLRGVYEKAWQRNWGFVPPTDNEMDDLFTNLRLFFDPKIGRFGMVDGQVAGFMMGLPDLNQVLYHARPKPNEFIGWTLLKVIWHWKISPKITQQRILLFGVNPEYRTIGVDAAIYLDYLRDSNGTRYERIDAGWILETNTPVINQFKLFGARVYKRYRFYQKAL